jgi:hypothetical protein
VQFNRSSTAPLLMVSLVSILMGGFQRIEISHRLRQMFGWKFDNLDITIAQRLCEDLYAASHTKDAGESLLKLVFDEVVQAGGEPCTVWSLHAQS